MATNTRSQRPTNRSGVSRDPPVSSSKPVSKRKRTTSSAAENPKTKQQKQETVHDEDEIRGTGKGQGRKGKKDEKKSRKGKKNRYAVLTDTTITTNICLVFRKTSAMRAEEDAAAGSPLKLTRFVHYLP
jgi:hypothetical protein